MESYIDLLCEMIRMRPVSRDIAAVNRVQHRVQEFLTGRDVFIFFNIKSLIIGVTH